MTKPTVLEKEVLNAEELRKIDAYRRATLYLGHVKEWLKNRLSKTATTLMNMASINTSSPTGSGRMTQSAGISDGLTVAEI